jgi:hypothetical protein
MSALHWRAPGGPRRWAIAAAALAATAWLPVGAAAASQVAWHSHGQDVPANGAVPSAAATSVPLNMGVVTVTDFTTGATTNESVPNSVVATTASLGLPDQISFTFGTDASILIASGGSLQAGQGYATPDTSIVVGAAGASCGTDSADGGDATAQIDQLTANPADPTLPATAAVEFTCVNADVAISGTVAFNITPTTPGQGYYLSGNDGSLGGFGNDNYLVYLGSLTQLALNAPVVDTAITPDGAGYWMLGADGGVFAFGDAGFFGSTGNIHLNQPVVGMAPTPDGKGYWFVAADGGVFAFGDAPFFGSMGATHLNQPVVGMAATPDGGGYWLVAADGGIFAFGDARFFGSMGASHLNQPVVGMAASPDGAGYWFVAADGGIFAFGDAGFFGSTGNITLAAPIVGMAAAPDGQGYWFAGNDGGVFAFGSAPFDGSLGGLGISNVVGIDANT